MLRKFSKHEIQGLRDLASFKTIFSVRMPLTISQKELIEKETLRFSQIFCSHDFADSDYTIMHHGLSEFETAHEWIEQLNIVELLKYCTYIIWTDNSVKGYFIKKVNGGILEIVLNRLELLINTNLPTTIAVPVIVSDDKYPSASII